MRKALVIIFVICLIALSICYAKTQQDDYVGFHKRDFSVVAEQDTHGGFHGDGSYYSILDCSSNTETALELVSSWNALPLSENLDLIMFGGEKDGMTYGYNLSEKAHMPRIENGYYYFMDRHSEAIDPSDDSSLFGRASFNFTLAMYDSDTNVLYYFEFDT